MNKRFLLLYFKVVRGAGHHVYADKPEPFNRLVQRICDAADRDTVPPIRQSRQSSSRDLTKDQTLDNTMDNVNSQLWYLYEYILWYKFYFNIIMFWNFKEFWK